MTEATRPTIATPVQCRDDLPDKVDVAIIGAGVIGIFAALYMVRRGLKVLVCEKGRIAGEQSSRNWGWIRKQGRDWAELPITIQAVELWHEVNRETNGACGIRTCGTTYLSTTQKGLEADASFVDLAREHDVDSRMLSRAEVDALFDGHGDGRWRGALHTASDACGEPWQAVPAVARLAQRDGALIREDCAVRALDIQAGRIAGIVTEDGRVGCDQVVLCAGAWSSLFARNHGIEFPQLAVRSTVARTEPMDDFFTGAASDEGLALRKRQDGGFSVAANGTLSFYIGPDALRRAGKYRGQLAASWHELRLSPGAPKGYPDAWAQTRRWTPDQISPFERMRVLEAQPKAKQVQAMQDRFAERFPKIGRPRIRDAWAGMIDAMPDVVPIVDRVPSVEGLIVATGMSGHGFGIGPGFGDILARMATGTKIGHDISRFRFERFTDGSTLELGPLL